MGVPLEEYVTKKKAVELLNHFCVSSSNRQILAKTFSSSRWLSQAYTTIRSIVYSLRRANCFDHIDLSFLAAASPASLHIFWNSTTSKSRRRQQED